MATLFTTLALALLAAGCTLGDDDDPGPIDAPTDTGAASCPLTGPGSPSGGCEAVVDDLADCPRHEDVCANVCGASYDCCFCGDSGTYETLFLDCAPCVDAGP